MSHTADNGSAAALFVKLLFCSENGQFISHKSKKRQYFEPLFSFWLRKPFCPLLCLGATMLSKWKGGEENGCYRNSFGPQSCFGFRLWH
ncbi:hypothetical protein GTHT12_03740 (plasmid) [Geobacillus thermodenitrificans]|nr:hypothetical protein GTHT12_03740 [Geobacillus thermodenitrificans]